MIGPPRIPQPVGTPDDPVPASFPLAVGAAALVLYLALTPRVMGDADSPELTIALAVAGVPHPTGYPLYVLLGHAWVAALHALGAGWAWAANAWSALAAAAAVGLMHALATRLIPPRAAPGRARPALALLPVGLFALHPAWLEVATVAEVYAAHLALLCGVSLVALALLRDPAPRPRAGTAFAFGLLAGAGLAHHLTSILFSVPLAAAVLGSRRDPRAALAIGAGAVLPLAAHGFTAWRALHPAAFQWPLLEPGWAGLLEHARGRVFSVFLGHFAPGPEERQAIAGAILPFAIPGLAGLVVALALRREPGLRPFLGALLAGAVLQGTFVALYGVPDVLPYLLPVLLVALLGLAAAAGTLPGRVPAAAWVPIAAAVMVAGVLGVNRTTAKHRRLEALDAMVLARWRAIPFERGIVLWTSDRWTRLRARQVLDGERPGLIVTNPAILTWAGPRRAFERRTGVDPLAGLDLHDNSELPLVAPNIARQTRLPVLDFERWRP